MQRTKEIREKERCCRWLGIGDGTVKRAQKGEAEVSRAGCGKGRVRVERGCSRSRRLHSARHAMNGILASGLRAAHLPPGKAGPTSVDGFGLDCFPVLSLFDPTKRFPRDASASLSAVFKFSALDTSTAFTHSLQTQNTTPSP
jgi:hypothetical protein